MYLPPHFAETRAEALHALMRARPLATLVTASANGIEANHVPLLLVAEGPLGTLRGHVARANPLWRALGEGAAALAIFHGPQAYVTPAWYPAKREHGRVVPTWNYAVAHAHGTLRAVDDAAWIVEQIEALTTQQEAGMPEPWAVADAPRDYVGKLAGAVVGIEMTIARLEGKWKTSQNQPAANRAGVAAGLRARGDGDDCAMAALVEALALDEGKDR